MRALIEKRIAEWEQGALQLQGKRQQLVVALREVDTQLQLNQGAISGAKELLEMCEPPTAKETPGQAPAEVEAAEPMAAEVG